MHAVNDSYTAHMVGRASAVSALNPIRQIIRARTDYHQCFPMLFHGFPCFPGRYEFRLAAAI